MSAFVDFFSDTKTRPGAAMRAAMAAAEVGDERAGEDPTVNRLVARCAALLGKEAAIYLPSGTLCNQISLAVHCRPGDEVLCDATSHIIGYEGGGPAAIAGVMVTPIDGVRGMYTGEQLRAKLRPERPYAARQRLVEVEQTSNLGGGAIWSRAQLVEIAGIAREHGLATHMDGARLMNASVASGVAPADYALGYDSVWIDFSKGLGAPGGAVLAGSAAFIREATRVQLRVGGVMRQSGIIAAACEYALDHNVARLAEDHANARRLAEGATAIDGLAVDAANVETNLVYLEVTDPRYDAAQVSKALLERGVRFSEMGPRTLRAVTHLDVDAAAVEKAIAALTDVLR